MSTHQHFKVLVIGAGTAGISVAARLRRKGSKDIGILDPDGHAADIDMLASERDRQRYERKRSGIDARQSQNNIVFISGAALAIVGAGVLAWDMFTTGNEPWAATSAQVRLGALPTRSGATGAIQIKWRW